MFLFDVGGAILSFGIVFWLVGGPAWLEEKTRQLRLDNDLKAQKLREMRNNQPN